MPYNEKLADRVRELIAAGTRKKIEEKRMFGGVCFMVDDKMCAGVSHDSLLVRLSPEQFTKAAEAGKLEPMAHGKRQSASFGFVPADALKTKKQLEHWVNLALSFNEFALPAKKKK